MRLEEGNIMSTFNISVSNSNEERHEELGTFDTIEELSNAFPVSINGSDLALNGLNAEEWEVIVSRLPGDGTRKEISDPRIFIEDLASPVDYL